MSRVLAAAAVAAGCVLSSCGGGGPTPTSPSNPAGSATVITDYTFRGISQTFEDMAVQAGITAAKESGVWVVVDLGEAKAVDALDPDMSAIEELSNDLHATGVTVFGRTGDAATPIHVRSFAPAHGVPEDPVCGSGNISVAAFLRETGLLKEFGQTYTARQGMQVGRDGRIQVRVTPESIQIGGEAVTCVDGNLRVL